MASIDISCECRLSCYKHMFCPQEGLSGSAEAQSPYRLWLSRKVEKAVETALQYEVQKKMLEDYALSRKWALPLVCEERRVVTMKIHSLLLQWRPDFSVQWGLKLRRALPILETTFSLMACCIEDYSQPLLVEPRLKKVLCLLESIPCQSSAQQHLSMLINNAHHHNLRFHCSSGHAAHAAEKACGCKTRLHVEEDGLESKINDVCQNAGFDNGMPGNEARNGMSIDGNLHEENIAKREHKTSALCSFCLQPERFCGTLDTKAHQKACSCKALTIEELDDDSLEWSKANLHSRGTVATLMASELRSSRKEEANRALLNAVSSQDAQVLEDNLNKHGKFASKWIVKKIMELQTRSSKKKERDLCLKRVVDKLFFAVAEEKCPNAWVPCQIKRSTSKGILGFLRISCHTPASEESGVPFSANHSSNLLDASDMSACCLLRMHSKHAGDQGEIIGVTQANTPLPCSTADHDRDDDNHIDSCHTNHDDVHAHHNANSECGSGEPSTCNLSAELDKSGGGFVGNHDGEADSFLSYGCLDVHTESSSDTWPLVDCCDDADLNTVACTHNQDVDGDLSMVPCTHIQDGNVTSTDEDDADNNQPDSHANVSWSDPGGSDTQRLPLEISASRSLSKTREDTSNPLEESEGTCMVFSNEDLQGGQGVAQANMQTGIFNRDRVSQEEPKPLTDIDLGLQANAGQATPSNVLPAEQSRDEERQEAERRRARVPLSSLLAQREDWSSRNPIVSSGSRANCPWDTWEEPSEALDPLCCVCMVGLRGAAFTPCGHTFCRKCSRELWKARNTCPLCNKLITSILDIF